MENKGLPRFDDETELRWQFRIEKYGEPVRQAYERWKAEESKAEAEEAEFQLWKHKRNHP